jgi:hypothetical protein
VAAFGDQGSNAPATLALIVVLAALAWRPTRRGVFIAAGLVVLVNAVRIGHQYVSWDEVIYRTAGNDYLTHESIARNILDTGSLRGGEDVFFVQPALRYIIFGLRLFVGDGDALYALAARSLLSLGVVLALFISCRRLTTSAMARILCFAAGAVALVVLNSNAGLLEEIDASISEWPMWAGLTVGSAVTIFARDRRWLLAGTLVLALCVVTRTEFGPALTLIVAVGLLRWVRRDRRWVLACAAVFVAVLLLPLAHNLVYGGRAVLSTTSSSANVRLPPSRLPDALSDADVRSRLERQLRGVLYAAPEAASTTLRLALRALQAMWLLTVAAVLFRWRRTSWTSKALLLAPFLAFAPYVFYDVFNYYPRHIIAAHLLMATTVMLVAGLELAEALAPRWLRRSARTA